jgi:hypothetical protein
MKHNGGFDETVLPVISTKEETGMNHSGFETTANAPKVARLGRCSIFQLKLEAITSRRIFRA